MLVWARPVPLDDRHRSRGYFRRPAAVIALSAVTIAASALGASRPASAEPMPNAADAPAASDSASRDPQEVADQANTPLPTRTQIRFKPSYTFANGDKHYESDVLFEPLLPYEAFLIPGLEVRDFWSIARIQWTAEGLQNSKGPVSGLDDLKLTDVVAHRLGPFNAALGFATVFPTATSTGLGNGKVQLGPAAALRLEAIRALKVAVLVQNLYSVAGSSQSPTLAYWTVQPFITLHLPAAVFLSSDATMNLYGHGGTSTIPINLGIGRAFGDHFVGTMNGWYTVADADRGTVKVEIVLDFQP